MSASINQIENIYINFRRAQSNFNSRGYRTPKNFENHFNTRLIKSNREALIQITNWFLTKWQNIDPYEYFVCGFEIHGKSFTYTKFLNEKIILLYITKDKNKKREIKINKKNLINSAKFVKQWITKNNCSLYEYINKRNGNQRVVIDHYLNNKIDASFFVWLIRNGMILTDNDRSLIPYIQDNFRKITFGLNDLNNFLKKLGDKLT